MTGILGQLKWESLKKSRKDNRLNCYIKVLKVKSLYQQMTLSPKLGVVEISTLWHFRLPLLIQMFIKVVSSPRPLGIGMPSPILKSHLLKIVLLSSLLWWELGTNSLITGSGEWLSVQRFTSKLSWSWSWKQETWLYWVCSWEIMADATSLKLPSPGLSPTLFPNKSVEPYSSKGSENVKITTLYWCMGRLFRAATWHNNSCCDL